ncbi:MAG: hypothetical protein A2255_04525 [Candidatus Melainabacteria bacterium RIFOXYA2_FULL_32_9]|nr:MAG: hypothetical protein A2255_04525 [Candidatus Melainabacteria bacterium RIFOXYA2_FULL_32_9]
MKPAILIQAKRANLIEREHLGFIVVVDKNENILFQSRDSNNTPVFLRSCAKPLQALPIITSGAYQEFNFTLEELAICCASHTGSDKHLKTIKNVLNKIKLKEDQLLCGTHEPIDVEARNYLIKHSLKPSNLHNNCSGKHSGMLAVCIKNNWNITNYLDFNHPIQQEITNIIKKYCNVKGNIETSIDGCSTPIHGIPLFKMGVGYLNLFLSNEGMPIKEAFMKNPLLIGGKGRLDSLIIESTQGRLISKTGAEGLCIVINPDEEKALVVKIMDASISARSLVTLECLKQLGWMTSKELENETLKNFLDIKIRTHNNTIVGEVRFSFKI